MEVAVQAGLEDGGDSDRLLSILRVYIGEEDEPQFYFLPLAAAWEDEREDAGSGLLANAVAKLRRRSRIGVLYDAFADEGFCRDFVAAMGGEKEILARRKARRVLKDFGFRGAYRGRKGS